MHILLTNDDGIYAGGIYALYLELKKLGRVTVVAPDGERSSIAHAITLGRPIWQRKVHRKGHFFGIGLSGTPADCVKFAVGVLLKGKRKPDMVISGINCGHNDGCSVFYSGTVAGAREGALIGIPSAAVSLATFADPDFTYAARFGARIAKLIRTKGIAKGTFLNVNVPAKKSSQIKGVRMTRQGMTPIHGTFRKQTDANGREQYRMSGKMQVRKKDETVDSYALNSNYVTVTPLHNDSTDYSLLEELHSWRV